jgi:hypothetical protein
VKTRDWVLIGLGIVVGLSGAMGGFLLGQSNAPSAVEVAAERSSARSQAIRHAEKTAARQVRATAYAEGEREGKSQGRRAGRRDGRRQAEQQIKTEQEAAARRLAAQEVVLDCPVDGPEGNFYNLSVRNMNCSEAISAMGSITDFSSSFTVAGFSCGQVSGATPGGQWRCVQGRRAFRFDWGD